MDHINGDGNKHRKIVKGVARHVYNWIQRNNYPNMFQVLCFNCNCGKNANNNVCPHVTSKV